MVTVLVVEAVALDQLEHQLLEVLPVMVVLRR
jgi:hypothetical protein